MRYRQLIITEPVANLRALARQGLKDRWGDAFLKGLIYILMITLPIMMIYALSGWIGIPGDNMSRLTEAYADFLHGAISQNEYIKTVSELSNGAYSWLYELLVSGALMFGVMAVFLRYRRRQEAPTGMLFSGFSHYSRSLALFLLMAIFTLLWTMLFIIPGIIAAYRYRLAFFILIDNPDTGPLEALNISKELMRGNKWKLFCLDLSFIGWAIVAVFINVLITMPLSAMVTLASPSSIITGSSLAYTVLVSLASAVTMGLLYMYIGTATAAFYERASGLLKYTDEVVAPAPHVPPPQ
ncbi:MAG: DUF975 family protein [Clostridiales Family XIII bacterium]|jgi:uncharacterized membrane protein|nr:DUF975 family protein [Clostridiales Family XIII bacterium]